MDARPSPAPHHRRRQSSRVHGVAVDRRPVPRVRVPAARREEFALDATVTGPTASRRTGVRRSEPNPSCAMPRPSPFRASATKADEAQRMFCSASRPLSISVGCCFMYSRRRHTTPVTQIRHARCSTARKCAGRSPVHSLSGARFPNPAKHPSGSSVRVAHPSPRARARESPLRAIR